MSSLFTMSTQLEHRDNPKEIHQKESQGAAHAQQEALEAYKPQAKVEKKAEPSQLNFDDSHVNANIQTAEAKAPEKTQDTEKHYHIKHGDNLTHIAKQELGENASEQQVQKYIKEIAKHNGIKNVDLIREDAWLDLPPLNSKAETSKADTSKEKTAVSTDSHKDGKQEQTAAAEQQQLSGHGGEQLPKALEVQPANGVPLEQKQGTDNAAPATNNAETTIRQPDTGSPEKQGTDNQPAPIDKQVAATDNPPSHGEKVVTGSGTDNQTTHGAEAPHDAPPPIQDATGKPAEQTEKAQEKTEKATESSELTSERAHLSSLAQDKMNSVESDKFTKEMTKLEGRTAQIQEQYEKQGLSPTDANKKAQEEIAKTYHEVSKLLEAKDNPDVPSIDSKQRTALAQEVMHNAAEPTTIRQGAHKTCTVAAVETRLYTREPSTAARVVADMATTGHYTGGDGTKVGLDKQSLTPDEDAKRSDDGNNRNFASQLFEVTAVNMHFAKTGSNIRYEQHKVDPTLTPPDTGERLVDYSKNPPEEIAASKLQKWFSSDITDATYHRPGIYDDQVGEISNSITGKQEKGFILNTYNSTETTAHVTSAKDLEDKLFKAKEAGQLPLLIAVQTGNEPFLSESGNGTAGGSGGGHMVTITDIQPGDPPKISLDNQWDEKSDHIKENKFSPSDLYGAMKPPGDLETIHDLGIEVKHNRETGKIDDYKELEFLRLQKNAGIITEDQFNKAFREQVRESQTRWHNIMSHGTNDYELLANIDKGKVKQNGIFLKLPPDQRAEVLKIENEVGYQSPYNLDNFFAYNLTQTRKEYEKEESDPAKPMTEERKKLYQKAFHEMATLMDSLPPERQENIRKYAWDFSAPDRDERQRKAKANSDKKDSA